MHSSSWTLSSTRDDSATVLNVFHLLSISAEFKQTDKEASAYLPFPKSYMFPLENSPTNPFQLLFKRFTVTLYK